jgi:glycine/D-amino acid oxidase-like deaminating enzyme
MVSFLNPQMVHRRGRGLRLDDEWASPFDLSPDGHPEMGRVGRRFEPVWLGAATGRGVEPR